MCFVKNLVHQKNSTQSAFKLHSKQTITIDEAESTAQESKVSEISKNNSINGLLAAFLINNFAIIEAINNNFSGLIDELSTVQKTISIIQDEQKQKHVGLNSSFEADPLISKVFGNKEYSHKIVLKNSFQNTQYKERNFNIELGLMNYQGTSIKNSNLIQLCFGVLDSQGNWITQNKVGDPLIKGRPQTQLYQGNASFEKLYLRQISRSYPNGVFNFVIYAKPSVLKYTNSVRSQSNVNQERIMPLILKEINIKAKKK